jgi:uncharacterized membrane protein YdjX (TVP38/TMEM64 family)
VTDPSAPSDLSDGAAGGRAAWWSLVSISSFLALGALVLMIFGRQLGLDSQGAAYAWLERGAHSTWGLPIAIAAFAVLAFVGAPQFVLIAAAVVVFGPITGSIYSWVGTMVSAIAGFWIGRVLGAGAVQGLVGGRAARLLAGLGRNGFWASLLVRLVPSAPFLVVNMVAGVTPMTFVDFLLGTAAGVLPKIALMALMGRSVIEARHGAAALAIALILAAIGAWIGIALAARAWLKARKAKAAPNLA